MWLYVAMWMGRDLYYRLHVIIASFEPWKICSLAKSITTHFSSPTKLPFGRMEYGFPTPPIISKCLSCYFNISFSLVQLVSSQRRGDSFQLCSGRWRREVCHLHHLWLLWIWKCSLSSSFCWDGPGVCWRIWSWDHVIQDRNPGYWRTWSLST